MRLVTRTLFAAAFAAPALTFTAPQFTGPEQLSGQSQIRSVDPGDFDGDGRMDLLAGINLFAFGGELLLFAGDGAGGVEDPVTVGTTSAAAREVRAADMDGDGRLDAVVTSTDGVHRFLQLPGGGFGPEELLNAAPYLSLEVVDIDLDGDLDLLAGNTSLSGLPAHVLQNNGANGFVAIDLTGSVGDSTTSLQGSDFDGDGDVDVLRTTELGTYLHVNDGQLGFTETLIVSSGPSFTSIGDIDGDGDDDIARAGFIGAPLEWFENLGGGAFGPSQAVLNSAACATPPSIVDIDGDGWNDLVLAQDFLDRVEWFRNDQNGSFEPGVLIDDLATNALLAPPVDLDGDFDKDVVIFAWQGVSGRMDLYRNGGEQGTAICSAVPNSSGAPAELAFTGSRSASQNELMAYGTALPASTVGVLIAGRMQGMSTPTGSSGTLCIGGSLERLGGADAVISVSNTGTFQRPVDLQGIQGSVAAGDVWIFQGWFRDATPSITSNFTDAIEVAFED